MKVIAPLETGEKLIMYSITSCPNDYRHVLAALQWNPKRQPLIAIKHHIDFLLFSIILIFTSVSHATIDTLWTKRFSTSENDIPNCIRYTQDGGLIIAGVSYEGSDNVKILRTDISGNIVWNNNYQILVAHEVAESIEQTSDGGFIVIGMTHPYTWDTFLLKINQQGTEEWSETYGDYYIDNGTYSSGTVKQKGNGSYITTGFTSCSVVRHDVYYIETSQSGILQTERCWANPSDWDHGRDIIDLEDDGSIICGYSHGTYFGPSQGDSDFTLIKLDLSGNIIWSKNYGGPGDDAAISFCKTQNDGYLMVGYSNSFGSGDYDIYAVMVNALGNEIWSNHYGDIGNDRAMVVSSTENNTYIIAGVANETYDVSGDMCFIEIDNDGELINALAMQNSDIEEVTDICKLHYNEYAFCAKSRLEGRPDFDFLYGVFELSQLDQAHLVDEYFNHSGSLAPGWTTQSNSALLTTPWAPVLESGDDYAIQTSQVAFSTPRTEWLISPIYDLSGYQDIELGYTHAYTHAGSTATVKYSTNGGLSWQNLTSYNTTTSGNIITDIANWANGQANVRFAFVFTGTFNVGGASWRIDDFFLDGNRTAPVASGPDPTQPPTAWVSLTGSVGCTWSQPLGVSGTDLEVRIDANGDGDYLDGGAENWSPIADLPDSTSLTFSTSVTYLQAGTDLAFEFRARSGQGLWGYSGTANAEGIADDWYVSIDVDTTPPTFADPVPPGTTHTRLVAHAVQPQVGV
jgi:hypothetical protein